MAEQQKPKEKTITKKEVLDCDMSQASPKDKLLHYLVSKKIPLKKALETAVRMTPLLTMVENTYADKPIEQITNFIRVFELALNVAKGRGDFVMVQVPE